MYVQYVMFVYTVCVSIDLHNRYLRSVNVFYGHINTQRSIFSYYYEKSNLFASSMRSLGYLHDNMNSSVYLHAHTIGKIRDICTVAQVGI